MDEGDGEYYYDDDGYDEDDDEGESWEIALENTYVTAKSIMDTNPEQCVAGLLEVVCDDPVGGRWTFKALKMLARVSRRQKNYEDMLKYYNRIVNFKHSDVDKSALQKAMMKFVEETKRVPVEYVRRVLETTICITSRDMKSFGKLWFNVKHNHAMLLLEENDLDGVLREMGPVIEWCKNDDLVFKKNTQLFLSYALLLEVYTRKGDYSRVRDIFFMTSSINVIPPSRVLGSVLESGGRMYIHYREWHSAFRLFSFAFQNYNETGDQRKLDCLKYLLMSSMLCGSSIDPFATQETKIYEGAPQIVPYAKLTRAFAENDVQAFVHLLEVHNDVFTSDPSVRVCLDPAVEKLRLNTIVAYGEAYEKFRMSRLVDVLLVSLDEVEHLCVRAVMDGLLHAFVDDREDVIVMHKKQGGSPDAERLQALDRWSNALLNLSREAIAEVERIA